MRVGSVLFVVVCVLGAACGPSPASNPAPAASGNPAPPAAGAAPGGSGASQAASGAELLIGGTVALSGPFSEPGRWYQRVWEWYFRDLNARGGLLGRPVKLILYDDESDPNKAASLYERLITVDKVDLLLGPYPTPTDAAVIPIAERNGMVLVQGGTAATSLLRGRNNQYTFTAFTALDADWAKVWVDWISTLPEAQRPRTVAIFTLNNPFTLGIQKGLPDQVASAGMRVAVNEVYDQGTTDFTALVQRARAANVDAVALLSYFPDSVLLTRTLAEQGLKPKTAYNAISSGLPTWTTDLKELGEYAVTSVQVWHTFPFKDVDRLARFIQDEFKVDFIPASAGWAMTVAQVLQAGVEGCGRVDQDCIAEWLRTHPVETASGQLKFDREGIPEYFLALAQVQGGKNVIIYPPNLATAPAVYPIP
ncbi:MAG TPA: amino acid ABC transporter substrate-binding protein [Chloroflexota bacterium]|jgi:branched-chain amino acid transport system substrate-binding protein|nr:amino acid ABC transporter substrate-binding protein [Chloroflexota bacterium]